MLSSRPVNVFGNTKTPGRGAFRSAHHAENNVNIFPSSKPPLKGGTTPFHSSSSASSYKTTTDEEGDEEYDAVSPLKRAMSPVKGSYSQAKPFQDKTPFPNRTGGGGVANTPLLHTPLPSVTKKFNFNFQPEAFTFNLNTPALHLRVQPTIPQEIDEEEDSILSTPLPSSSRRQSRFSRLSLNRTFETPQNDGRHWDVSDIDIELNNSLKIEEDPNAVTIDEDAEIEYMPPKVEVPYELPFDYDIPDYKKLGSLLFKPIELDAKDVFGDLPRHYEPLQVPELETLERLNASSDSDSDIEDPFYHIRKERAAAAFKPIAKSTAAPRTIPRSTSATGIVASRARPPSASSRPGTAASSELRSRPPSRPATVAAHVKTDRFAGSHQTTARPTTSRSAVDLASQRRPASAAGHARSGSATAIRATSSSRTGAASSTLTRTQSTTLGTRPSRVTGTTAPAAATPGVSRTRSATVTATRRAPTTQVTASRGQLGPPPKITPFPSIMPLANAPHAATALKPSSRTASGSAAKPSVPAASGGAATTAASRSRAMTTSADPRARPTSRAAGTTATALAGRRPVAAEKRKKSVEKDALGLDLDGLAEEDDFLFDI